MKFNSTTITVIFSVAIIVGLGFFIAFAPKKGASTTGVELIPFAKCLADSGTKFYGAFWCPHCKATKAMFGQAAEFLTYIECSTADTQGQTQICIDNNIKHYPTWVFPDGTIKEGELTLQELSDQTKCPMTISVASTTFSSATSSIK